MINLCNKPSAWKSHWTWILFCWKIHIVIVCQGFKVSLLVQVFFHNRDHDILIKQCLNCLCLLIIQSSMKGYVFNISTSPFYSYSIPLLLEITLPTPHPPQTFCFPWPQQQEKEWRYKSSWLSLHPHPKHFSPPTFCFPILGQKASLFLPYC